MFIIGIDPHKGSHTAVAIDDDERLVGELLVRADRRQRERLLCWAAEFEPRLWTVEGASGVGALTNTPQRVTRTQPSDAPMCCQGVFGGAGRPVMGHSCEGGLL